MIHIHATKKLLQKIPDAMKSSPELSAVAEKNAFNHWHANLILIDRRQCVLFVNDATRFPVFVKELTKLDFANLDRHFEDVFINTLLKINATEVHLDRAFQLLDQIPWCFDNACDRSVQGTINQMTQDIVYGLSYQRLPVSGASAYQVSASMTDRPCFIKGQKDCLWPQQAMLDLLAG